MGWLVTAGWFLSGSLAAVRCGWVIRGAQKAEGGKRGSQNHIKNSYIRLITTLIILQEASVFYSSLGNCISNLSTYCCRDK